MGLFFKMMGAVGRVWILAVALGAAVFGFTASQALAYDIVYPIHDGIIEINRVPEPIKTIERQSSEYIRGDTIEFAPDGSAAFAVGDTLEITLSGGATFGDSSYSFEESAGGAGTGDLTFAVLQTASPAGKATIRFRLKDADNADAVSGVFGIILSGASIAGQYTHINLPPTYGTDIYMTFTLRNSVGTLKGSVRHLVFESTLPPSASNEQAHQEIQTVLTAHARFMTGESVGLSGLLTGKGFGGGNVSSLLGQPGPVGTALASVSDTTLPVSLEMSGGQGRFAANLKQVQSWNGALGLGDHDPSSKPPSELAGMDSPVNVWIKGRWQGFTDTRGGTKGEGDSGLVMVGADYRYRPDTLIGLLAQLDVYDQTTTGRSTKAKGKGWMAGPYLVTRPLDNLIWDARVAWGTANHEINYSDYGWDEYETMRWQVETNLTGEMEYQDWDIYPQLGLNYFVERQKAYQTQNATAVSSQSIPLGNLSFGPKVSRTWDRFDDTTVRPFAALKGVWDFNSPNIVHSDGSHVGTERLHAKVEFGGEALFDDGRRAYAKYALDGIGVAGYTSHSVELVGSTPVDIGRFTNGGTLKTSFSQSVSTVNTSEFKLSMEMSLN